VHLVSVTSCYAAVLCGCETWSITLREEHRLRILENRAPTKIPGSRRNVVTDGLHDADYFPGELYVIHSVHLLTFRILNQICQLKYNKTCFIQVPTTTRFGTKAPSSGSLLETGSKVQQVLHLFD
jgi:hypothetical protein